MKSILFFFSLLISLKNFGQDYSHFKWNSEEVTFKSVQMTAYYTETNKIKTTIFTGYKDATIVIKQGGLDNPTYTTISAKLSGYFEIEDAVVSEFEYKIKDYQTYITYSATGGTDLLYVSVFYDDVTGKVKKIFAAATKNYVDKKSKTIFFNLSGFE